MFNQLGIEALISYGQQLGIKFQFTNADSSYVEFRSRTVYISPTDTIIADNCNIVEVYRATISHELGHLTAYIQTAEDDKDYDHYCERTAWSLGESIYKQVYGEPSKEYYEIRKTCLLSHGYWREA